MVMERRFFQQNLQLKMNSLQFYGEMSLFTVIRLVLRK